MIDISGNRYCGPYALAYLLGLESTSEASAMIRDFTRQRAVKGVYTSDLLMVLRANGKFPLETSSVPKSQAPTLARWLKGIRGGTWLVQVTGHFIVVDGWRIYDSAVPQGCKRKDYPYRRKLVQRWWRFR